MLQAPKAFGLSRQQVTNARNNSIAINLNLSFRFFYFALSFHFWNRRIVCVHACVLPLNFHPVDGYYNVQKQHSTSSGNGGSNNVVNSEGYSYVNDVPSLQSSHHRHSTSSSQQKSTSSSSHRDYQQPNRTRRTQRRVTHNEKRYHSGQH